VARIVIKSTNFLVKVKVHRGETLNEGADDLVETGRVMVGGQLSRWTTTGGKNERHGCCTRTMTQWKKKAHGLKPFATHQEGERENLYWKSDCSLEQINDVRGYLRNFRNTVRTQMEINKWLIRIGDLPRQPKMGYDHVREMDTEGGVEQVGDYEGTGTTP
jgi:hypothetical protein